jgi:glycerol-3-phosphate dehydrogenase (NAD(P)+)
MSALYRVAVLGGGSFGTALCNMIADKGHHATLWLRNQQRADEINAEHKNSRYLPDLVLNENVQATTELAAAVKDIDMVFVAVPSHSCRAVCLELARFISADTMVISTTKGIENPDFKLMSQVITEALPNNPLGVLSGPNLAKEIAAKQITATVIASEHSDLIERVQEALHSGYFRVYGSQDVFGVELSGALKNIYAIIAGLGAAMELGDNTKAMLMTRSLAEMSRFAVSMGANPMTFLGLAGIGDLLVTCSSALSRNYQVGYAIGSGKTLEQAAEALGQVAEGVNTLKVVTEKAAELDVYMPLAQGLSQILFEQVSVADMVTQLMLSEQSEDVEFTLGVN